MALLTAIKAYRGDSLRESSIMFCGFTKFPITFFKRQPNSLWISQETHELVLRTHLQKIGVEIERGVELTSIVQNSDFVQAELTRRVHNHSSNFIDVSNETVHADYVVGADGAKSKQN